MQLQYSFSSSNQSIVSGKRGFNFFLLITLLNIIPVLSYKFHATLDGPAHLYNSNLINHLLFGDKTPLSNFFSFNPEPIPNWSGHFILSLFNLMMPAYLAEKLLLILYLIALPFSFRSLIKTLSPNNYLLSYLIFPFTYSFLFYYGFYNSIIAVVFMIVSINYWLKHQDNLSIKKGIILFLLLLITYFSHLFIFAVLLLIIGLQIIGKALLKLIGSESFKEVFIGFIKQSLILLLLSAIPLVLLVNYFHSHPPIGDKHYLSSNDLMEYITKIKPFIGFNFDEEKHFTHALYKMFLVLFTLAFLNRILVIRTPFNIPFREKIISGFRSSFSVTDFFLLGAIIMLVLYFILPDFQGDSGFVSVRLCFLFYLLLAIWIAVQRFPRWMCYIAIFVTLLYSYKLNKYRKIPLTYLNEVAIQINDASKLIKPNSVVLPLDFSNNFNMMHFSNYLGIDKPMIILENYECNLTWFPLMWNRKEHPNAPKGNITREQFISSWTCDNHQPIKIDYIFLLGKIENTIDSCTLTLKKTISENYVVLDSTSEFFKIYQLKE